MSPNWGGVLTPLTARARGWQLPASWARGPCQPLLAQLLARPADSHGHLLTPTHERWRAAGPSGFPGLLAPLPRRLARAPTPASSSSS